MYSILQLFVSALLAIACNAAVPSDIKSTFSLSTQDDRGPNGCPATLQPLEYTDTNGYLRIYNGKLRAGTRLCSAPASFIPLLSAPVLERELSRNSDLLTVDNRDRGLLKNLQITHSIVGINAYSDLICGKSTFRKGTIMAFIRNATAAVPELGLSDALKDFTYLLMLETGVKAPKRCIYKTAGDFTQRRPDCFPAHATVQLATTQRSVRMDQLDHGHHIEHHGPVFAFSHRDAASIGSYIRFSTDNDMSLMVSPGHYVFSAGKMRVAHSIRTGDFLDGKHGQKMRVVQVENNVRARGRFNPHTPSGQLIVDGFRVSCYTQAVHPFLAHKALLPVRFLYHLTGAIAPLSWLHKDSSLRRLASFLPNGPLALEWQ